MAGSRTNTRRWTKDEEEALVSILCDQNPSFKWPPKKWPRVRWSLIRSNLEHRFKSIGRPVPRNLLAVLRRSNQELSKKYRRFRDNTADGSVDLGFSGTRQVMSS
jgi:hypothetical protein